MPEHRTYRSGRSRVSGADYGALLIEAGVVLASSLDQRTTMAQVAGLTVPSLTDVCVIDLVDETGAINEVAVAAEPARIARELEQLRAQNPLSPAGEHPVARVIRSGQPELLREMSATQLSAFAEGREHARFMIENGYRSAVVAPLVARERTLGALSALRLGEHEPFEQDDLELICELARRASLAIDNARLFGELRRVEQWLEAVLAAVAEAIVVEDSSGRTVFANQAAAELLGLDNPQELVERPQREVAASFLILDEDGRELDLEQTPGKRLLRGEKPEPMLVRNIVRATGEERWLRVRSAPLADLASGRVEHVVNVYENVTDVKRAQLTESFIAEASRVLSSSLDYEETLQQVARLAVPQIADWCSIVLLDERGELDTVAVHHRDPNRRKLAMQMLGSYRDAPGEPLGVAEVIRTEQAQIYNDIAVDALADYARDPEHLRMLRGIGPTAVCIVPLVSAVKTIGAITFAMSESGRRLTAPDLALAVRLGRRAGTAVENARLYTERSRIAHVLQQALLPASLPRIDGAEVRALYHAAGEANQVGGDFYDVFRRRDGGWVLAIGDVVGKGPQAAGVTGLARHTLRAASASGRAPAEMLQMLHDALREQEAGRDMCTVCLVMLGDVARGAKATIALAGHPAPLLLDEHRNVAPVGRHGTVLGAVDPIEINETQIEIERDQTLLMYTDGVVDAGRPYAALEEAGLIEVCREHASSGLESLLHAVELTCLERANGGLRDDLALLALRLDGGPPAISRRAKRDGTPRSRR